MSEIDNCPAALYAGRVGLPLKITATNINLKKLFFIVVLGIIFFSIPKMYLGDTFPVCLYRIILNKKCIGCGTTRAVWSVLHLKFSEAYEYNKMIIITFPLLAACIIKWIMTPRVLNFTRKL
jgi:hypothetical protein